VQWTAAASGGSGSYEYQFWLYSYGTGVWSVAQPYGTSPTYTWDTTGLSPGNYLVDVYARTVGSTATMEVYKAVPYKLTMGPATAVTLTPSPGSPQTAGTSVQWTAGASGGSGSYEYQFWVYSYGTGIWSVAQPYGSSPTYAWSTTELIPGEYLVDVWARNAGSTATFEVYLAVPYVLR